MPRLLPIALAVSVVCFLLVHLVLVVLAGPIRSIGAMITGRVGWGDGK